MFSRIFIRLGVGEVHLSTTTAFTLGVILGHREYEGVKASLDLHPIGPSKSDAQVSGCYSLPLKGRRQKPSNG